MKIIKIPKYLFELITGKRQIYFSIKKNEKIKNFGKFLLENNFSIKNDNDKKYKKLIAVDGIAAFAGSSAITDFFAEFSNCTSLGGVDELENPERGINNSFEFDFFRDYNGLYNLEKICDFDSNRILNGCIRDFIQIVKNNYYSGISFYGEFYLSCTQKFLKKILDFYYEENEKENIYFVKKINLVQYRNYANEYITSMLNNIPSQDFLVLDNICSISNPKNDVLFDYFGEYKIITSIRDPRDLYTAAMIYPNISFIPKDPYLFSKYYKWYVDRYKFQNNKNVLLIRFEDFVNNYDNTSSKIIKFCGLDTRDHIKRFMYFDIKKSRNNIGIYKNYKDQEAIKIIEQELQEYLYIDCK